MDTGSKNIHMSKTLHLSPAATTKEKKEQQSSSDIKKEAAPKEAENKPKANDTKEKIALKSIMEDEPEPAEVKPTTKMDTNETATSKGIEDKPVFDINESAEAFINKFKKQLMIQRAESIENYKKMLARGT